MKQAKLKQYGLAICLLVSLSLSTVSGGTCLHHPKQVETNADTSPCHQHSEETSGEIDSEQQENGGSGKAALSVVPNDKCCCIEPARKVVVKTENLKIEKQTLEDFPASKAAVVFVARKITFKTEVVTPFYLTDSFYNLALGRAPPTL